jgi:cytochrome c553
VRALLATLLLALAACGSEAPAPVQTQARPAALAFDGAEATDPAERLKHGERLTRVLGCGGCHGPELQGQRFYELYASNLTRDVRRYGDAELARLIRAGEAPGGRDLWAMPSEIFQHLGDADLGAVIAHLRSVSPAGPPTGRPLPWTAETRRMMAAGTLKPAARLTAELRGRQPADLGPRHALGRYVAMVTCAECHGPELGGGEGTPDLVVASAYSRAEFERLMTTGVPTGGRTLTLMAEVARGRFVHLTPRERDAVYAYLAARAARQR